MMEQDEINKLLNFDEYYENKELGLDLFDDILLIEDDLIPRQRADKLKEILYPFIIEDGELVKLNSFSLNAAIILASWGYIEGLRYLEKIVFYGLKYIPNFMPHHLRLYNQSYEKILDALFYYKMRMKDIGSKTQGLQEVSPIIIQLIERAKSEFISLLSFKYELSDNEQYEVFKIPLENTLIYLKNKKNKTYLDEYNIEDIEEALLRPNLLDEVRRKNK